MKAWIVSDIHATNVAYSQLDQLEVPEADICICAGDISGITELSMEFLRRFISPHMPVVCVLGNHDYYGSSIDEALESARRHAGRNITVLENETTVVDGVRIIGATLWTDFEVEHGREGGELPLPERKALALSKSKQLMTDFRAILRSDWFKDGMPGLLTAKELIARHVESRDFIAKELATPFDGKTVVLSHHAPLARSLHPAFLGDPTNGAFASDLSGVFQIGKPDYWIHGHVHHFFDYQEGGTRVLCNPRGYRQERGLTGFIPGLVVDL